MNKITTSVALAGLLLAAAVPATAEAQHNWSIIGGQTVSPGADVIYGEFGWPDVTLGYTHGMSHNFDLGARMKLIYGVEGTTSTQFGMAFDVPLRWTLIDRSRVSLMFHIDPGIRFYTTDPFSFGFQILPFGLTFDVRPAYALRLGVGFDFQSDLFVSGANNPIYSFGPQVGPFFEYLIDPHLSIGLDTRFGVNIAAASNGAGTDTRFAFRAQMLLAYRL